MSKQKDTLIIQGECSKADFYRILELVDYLKQQGFHHHRARQDSEDNERVQFHYYISKLPDPQQTILVTGSDSGMADTIRAMIEAGTLRPMAVVDDLPILPIDRIVPLVELIEPSVSGKDARRIRRARDRKNKNLQKRKKK